MKFYEMIKILQNKNNGRIVICNSGGFYIALGKDAIKMNEILDLKLTCHKNEVCKVGFPKTSLEKYTGELIKQGYGYVVYNFDNENEEIRLVEMYKGKNNKEFRENIGCSSCPNCKIGKKIETKYSRAMKKYEIQEKMVKQDE